MEWKEWMLQDYKSQILSRCLKHWTKCANIPEWRINASANKPSLVQIMACRLFSQAIIWISADLQLTGPHRTIFSEILIQNQTFSFKEMHFKMSAKYQPFCLCLNVSTPCSPNKMAEILHMSFCNAYSLQNIFVFWFKFHWSLLPKWQ